MFRVYLSGSMAGRPHELVKEERDNATKRLARVGIHAVDPGASEQKLWKNRKNSKISPRFPKKIMEAFKTQDKWLIRRCDALLVLTGDTPSDGTWREMCYAEKIEIPVIMIAPRRLNGDLMGWSNIEVPNNGGHIVHNLKGAIRIMKRKYVKEYELHRSYFDEAIKNAKQAVSKTHKHHRKTRKQKRRRYGII